MKRRPLLILIATLLAVAGAVYLPVNGGRPAHAFTGACLWSDAPGEVYDDWYGTTHAFINDSYIGGGTRQVNIDLRFFRYGGGNGVGDPSHCYRSAYVSTWLQDGSGCYCEAHLRMWVCGAFAGEFDSGVTWSNRNDVEPDFEGGGSGFGALTLNIPAHGGFLDDNESENLNFADYGQGANCLPQGDTAATIASSPTWTPLQLESNIPTGFWYCKDGNGVVCS